MKTAKDDDVLELVSLLPKAPKEEVAAVVADFRQHLHLPVIVHRYGVFREFCVVDERVRVIRGHVESGLVVSTDERLLK